MKDVSSRRDEALDNAYKCDSDVEDDEGFASTNENHSVQAGG